MKSVYLFGRKNHKLNEFNFNAFDQICEKSSDNNGLLELGIHVLLNELGISNGKLKDSLCNYSIILPTLISCSYFNSLIVNSVNNGFLPKIHTFKTLISNYAYLADAKYCSYQELSTLINILNKIQFFSKVKASGNMISVAKVVLDIFEKKSSLGLQIEDLKSLFVYEYPEHFEWLLNVIQDLEIDLEKYLAMKNCLPSTKFQKQVLSRINHGKYFLIGGIYCNNSIVEFIKKNNTTILFEVSYNQDNLEEKIHYSNFSPNVKAQDYKAPDYKAQSNRSQDNIIYQNLKKAILIENETITNKIVEKIYTNKALSFYISNLLNCKFQSPVIDYFELNQLANPKLDYNANQNLQYFEFETLHQEINYIIENIRNTAEKSLKIGILARDSKTFRLLVRKLESDSISFKLESSIDLRNNSIIELIRSIMSLAHKFSLAKVLFILKNKHFLYNLSELYCNKATHKLKILEMELSIRKNFIHDEISWLNLVKSMEFSEILTLYFNLKKLGIINTSKEFYRKFIILISNYFPCLCNNADFIEIQMKIQLICKTLKRTHNMKDLLIYLLDNISMKYDQNHKTPIDFDLMNFEKIKSESIVYIFDSFESMSMFHLDKIFITNFYSGNEIRTYSTTFLPTKISEGLLFAYDKYMDMHFLQNIFNKKQIVLTKSQKKDGAYTTKSKLVLNLEMQKVQLDNKLQNCKKDYNSSSIVLQSICLPKVLYATHLQKILNDPYSFYVEKILKLTRINDIDSLPSYSEFGSLVHKCIEVCSGSQNLDLLFEEMPTYINNMWSNNITKIVNEVKKFHDKESFLYQDHDRKIKCEHVIGTILNHKNNQFELKAIVDRIEEFLGKFDCRKKIILFDYKTGICPTLGQVTKFVSIQLLVSCFITIINTVISLKPEYLVNETSSPKEIWNIFSMNHEIELQYLKLSTRVKINRVQLKIDEEIFTRFFYFLIDLLDKYTLMSHDDFRNSNHERYKDII